MLRVPKMGFPDDAVRHPPDVENVENPSSGYDVPIGPLGPTGRHFYRFTMRHRHPRFQAPDGPLRRPQRHARPPSGLDVGNSHASYPHPNIGCPIGARWMSHPRDHYSGLPMSIVLPPLDLWRADIEQMACQWPTSRPLLLWSNGCDIPTPLTGPVPGP